MTTSEFLDLICHELERPLGTLTVDDTDETVEEWDSVGHMGIIATMKQVLGVQTDQEKWQTFTCLGDLVDMLKRAGFLEDQG